MTGLCRSGKTGSYPDEATANAALLEIWAEEPAGSRRKLPCRAYPCEFCGDFHLTSQPKARRRHA